jgi:pyridoxal phosphate enzyme (YggS family)
MNEQEQAALRERYRLARGRLEDAARASGRSPDDVVLLAVSKLHGAAAIRVVAACGQRRFGENYVQEARTKQAALADLHLEWHAIGRVQTNKAKDAVGHFAMIHTVDSQRLAAMLSRRLPEGAAPQPVLIQINLGGESQKAGIAPVEAPALADAVAAMPGLDFRGLMCLPPVCAPGAARPFFAALRRLRDELAVRLGRALPCLSMGMSGDFEDAVAEGSTLVRIGTDIFGPRALSE